jgi:transposase InsO family protein
LQFIDPGKPSQNGFVESCNGRFRDECLARSWFTGLADSRAIVQGWRVDDNERRPHSAHGYWTPDEVRDGFSAQAMTATTTTTAPMTTIDQDRGRLSQSVDH